MKRKLCRMSRGRNASARCRRRTSGQIYRAATIPHAMKLNAMLMKNQIICCGMINLSFLEITTSEARRKIRQPCRGMIHEPRLCLPVAAGNRGDRDQEHRTAECNLAGSSRLEE